MFYEKKYNVPGYLLKPSEKVIEEEPVCFTLTLLPSSSLHRFIIVIVAVIVVVAVVVVVIIIIQNARQTWD